ncbi:mite allergen Der p 3-like [Phymastichus coffea]|uniref:mite allergen Der p 3-like n=1 Tax=Phymastichus coffea TaxID=108790 RepID=UPI00273C2C82|nr:mite allergen Der p 3-like [Phymastichus coffea]XP_058799326.1 mite allergen Der p 3-like [Phymastichus coffea]
MIILPSFILLLIMLVQNEWIISVKAILDGSTVDKNEFPFTASFQNISKNNEHFCGGIIVHEMFILTAAHCIAGKVIKDIRVVAGSRDLKSIKEYKNVRRIIQIFKNPNYNKPLPRDNDIALVKLDGPYKMDKCISKAKLVPEDYRIPDDLIVHIIGWGVTKSDIKAACGSLKKTKVIVLSHSQCTELYAGKVKVSNTVFCTTHNSKKNRGACYGDSGGPVLKDKTVVIGVISVNYAKAKCGDKNHPDLQTNVAKYRKWIDNIIFSNI